MSIDLAPFITIVSLAPAAVWAQSATAKPGALIWTAGEVQTPPALIAELGKTLAARLEATGRWSVLEPNGSIAEALTALAVDCSTPPLGCAQEAARLADVDYVLTARLTRERGDLRLWLWWISAAGEATANYQGAFRKGLERTDAQLAVDRLLARLPPIEPEVLEISATPALTEVDDTLADAAPPAADEWAEDESVWRVDEPEAELLHAHAAIFEARGEIERARELLRQALALAPDDPLIAFELARLTVEQPQGAAPTDADAFLARPGSDHDSQLLLAHLLIRRGERESAADLAARLAAIAPENTEAGRLHAQLGTQPTRGAKSWRAQVRLALQADSNVSVLPEDDPSQLAGLRSGADGALAWLPRAGIWQGDYGVRFSAAAHLNDREALDLYDLGAGTLLLHNRLSFGRLALRADLHASAVLIDSFTEQFLREAGGRVQLGLQLGSWEVGLFGRAGYRDFVFGNLEAGLEDRDGPSLQAGLVGQGRLGLVRLRLVTAALGELADGAHQDVQGALANADAALAFADLRVEAGFAYALRNYPHSRRRLGPGAGERTDHRLTPYLRLAYAFTDSYAVFGSYTFLRNFSLDRFDYARHLGQLGVEATW